MNTSFHYCLILLPKIYKQYHLYDNNKTTTNIVKFNRRMREFYSKLNAHFRYQPPRIRKMRAASKNVRYCLTKLSLYLSLNSSFD